MSSVKSNRSVGDRGTPSFPASPVSETTGEPSSDAMRRVVDFRYQPTIQQTCIGLVDDPFKTIVREDGSLNYHYVGRNDFSAERLNYAQHVPARVQPVTDNHDFLHRLKPQFAHRDRFQGRTQEFGDPRAAIVRTVETYDHTRLAWDAFAYTDVQTGLRCDVILWELSVDESFGYAPTRAELTLYGPREGAPEVWESADTTDFHTYEGLRLPGLNLYEFLHPGETRRGVFAVVLQGAIDPSTVTWRWGCFAREESLQYWLNLRPFRRTFSIPDTAVQAMVESCGRNILQAREVHDGVVEYQVGPTIYRGLWTVDGHFLLQSAHIMNRGREAFEQGLLAILKRIQPDGSLELIPQHYKETGIAIATIVRQCELMGDDSRLRELWPTILRAVEHIRHLRRNAAALGPEYPGRELFPPAVVDGGIEGPYPDYTTPAWILIGLKFARDAGRRLGLHDSEAIAGLYDEIYGGFIRAAQRDQGVTEEGIPYIPMIMEKRAYNKPQTATWAFAQAMYPGEVFGPDHPFVTNLLALLDSVDDEEGIPKETGWIHDQAVWGYSAMFYAQVWLYARRPEKAIDYLYAFANHAAPSRVWREEQSLASSHSAEYCGDMPHNWGSAEFIRLVRNAIVMERGGGLELLAGLPAEWLPTEETALEIESTPTRYGRVSVRLTPVDTIESGDGGDVGVPPTERKDGRPDQGTDTACRYRLTYRREPGVVEPLHVMVHWNGREHESWLSPGDVGASRTVDLPPFQARRTAQGNT